MTIKRISTHSKFATDMLYLIGNLLHRLRFAVHAESPPEVPEAGVPLVFLAKHQSNFDVPLGFVLLRRIFKRDAYCLIKKTLEHPVFMGFFLKIGGIPVDRSRPQKSKKDLLFARRVLYEGNALIIFPEQIRVPDRMGEGKAAGFRFIVGKPNSPLPVISVGISYQRGFIRKKATFQFSPIRYFANSDDPALFMHERMKEIAALSGMDYPFSSPGPTSRRL